MKFFLNIFEVSASWNISFDNTWHVVCQHNANDFKMYIERNHLNIFRENVS